MLKDLLQGKPLGHPLHPMLVHLPIGLFFLSFVLDVISLAADATSPNAFNRPAGYAMGLGVITALLAAVPGLADYSSIRRDHPAREIARWHMLLNLAAVALYPVNLVVRWGRLDEPRAPGLAIAMSLVGVGLLSVSGYLGGKMVYDDGIGVGRHRRKRGRTPSETIKVPDDQGWIELGGMQGGMQNGDSLRADIGGTVVAIVKVDGQIFAFQEFCTHRFGPLSEGTFEGHNVRCPWHGSCFDMRTGRVVEGPAKTDIRAFEVEIVEGRARIRVTGDV